MLKPFEFLRCYNPPKIRYNPEILITQTGVHRMRRISILIAATILFPSMFAGEVYKLGPDSEAHDGVPKGAISEYKFTESKIFPGTTRSYWIYLPPNFKPDTEYPFMVFFDGGGEVNPKGGFRVPIVFDNLIAKGEIPAMVGLFINPGQVPPIAKGTQGRSTRSFEYDTPDEACPRFVIEEMIPLVAQHAKLSPKPDDHAVWGISSGGIAAFNCAWQRPDYFRKVISYIGSFTNIRGAYWFPSAIRKTERKPIRVYLQEGSHDLDNVHGNWPLGNESMAAALKFAGYDYTFTMGDGAHSGQQGGAILPDALRWLWRKAGPLPAPAAEDPKYGDMALSGILIPSEEWQLVVDRKESLGAACSDVEGNFYFSDLEEGVLKISLDGKIAPFNAEARHCSDMKFGPDGRLYASLVVKKQLSAYDRDGKTELLASNVIPQALVITHRGSVYFSDSEKGKILVWTGPGKISPVADLSHAGGIALSPNQETLAVSESSPESGAKITAFRVETDGSLTSGMSVMPLSQYGRAKPPQGFGMVCDTRRRFYCGTSDGIDVFDPDGRPIGLILSPSGKPVTSIALSGPDLTWLFALSDGQVFKRKVNAKGFLTSAPPILADERKK